MAGRPIFASPMSWPVPGPVLECTVRKSARAFSLTSGRGVSLSIRLSSSLGIGILWLKRTCLTSKGEFDASRYRGSGSRNQVCYSCCSITASVGGLNRGELSLPEDTCSLSFLTGDVISRLPIVLE